MHGLKISQRVVNAISKAFLSIDASSNPAKLTVNHNEFAQIAESDYEQPPFCVQ